MHKTGTSVPEYIQMYKDSWEELGEKEKKPLKEYPHGSIHNTWRVSYGHIQRQDPTAANFLKFWAYLNNKDIWFELFTPFRTSPWFEKADTPIWFKHAVGTLAKFKGVVLTLLAYCMIEANIESGAYSMHPVVHDWCYETYGRSLWDEHGSLATIVTGLAVPDLHEKEFSRKQRRLLPHSQRCYRWVQDYFNLWIEKQDRKEILLHAVSKLGDLYYREGQMGRAEGAYLHALVGYQAWKGFNHICTLEAMTNLGITYREEGKLVESESMHQQALAGFKKTLGGDALPTLQTMNNVGLLLAHRGKLKEAEEMYELALRGKEKRWGEMHPSTLETVHNIGILRSDQGNMAEAEKMYKRALFGKEKRLGPENVSTLKTVNNLGVLYMSWGKIPEAEEMLLRALKGKEEVLGSDHISTLQTVNNLGILYYHERKLDEAEVKYRRALEGQEMMLGRNHLLTSDTALALGVLYVSQERLGEAEAMYRRALDGYSKGLLGWECAWTLEAAYDLGILFDKQGNFKEAESMFRQALLGKLKLLGASHMSTLGAVHYLGCVLKKQGRLSEAREVYRKELLDYRKSVPKDDAVNYEGPRIVELSEEGMSPEEVEFSELLKRKSALSTCRLGSLYAGQGKRAEAEPMYELVTLHPGKS